jgi:ATP synthase protein I
MKEPKPEENPWRGFFIVSALGADVVVCLAVGYFIGGFFGRRFGSETTWTIGGMIVGLALGVVSVIVLLKSLTEASND